eukprot:GHVO01006884.1.p1 GENE.GHVO01006884.1~~GHVO01006884.1.p1  ORF type:complete len:102 (+),score=19.26 GHVO01006884.1:74-379(+)
MSDIHINRPHSLGLSTARELANKWMEGAAQKIGLTCSLVAGETEDQIKFEHSGVTGVMKVRGDAFELEAKLGLMMKAVKPMIEAEIDKNLSRLLEKAGGQA